MSKALNDTLRSFLLRNQDQLQYRKFLISILTNVSNRPVVFLSPYAISLAIKGQPVEIPLRESLDKPIRPNLKAVKEGVDMSKLDALDKWAYETNLTHVKETNDLVSLMTQYQNFLVSPPGDREAISNHRKEVSDISEEDYVNYLLSTKFDKTATVDVVYFVDTSNNQTYIGELRMTSEQLRTEQAITACILSDQETGRLMTEIDTLTVTSSDIPNVREPITTTVGRVILNAVLILGPLEGKLEFYNRTINIDDKDILKDVIKGVINKDITVQQYKKFMDAVYYLGHFTELCTPCMSEKSLTTDPRIAARKAELYKEYAGRLNDPLVISKIEDELIAMDKAWLKGDNAMRFYKPLGGKTFDLWRKKLYIAVGGIEAFSKDTSKFDFIPNSLEEGMTLKDLPKYGNESRKGSYQRGHETRNGGALTKYIVRAFHDSRIVEDDCGTNQGVHIDFSVHDPKKFKGRYIMFDGKWTEITDDVITKIKPKSYLMRSPQYCQCRKNGYCYKCMGKTFADMDIQQLTMNVVDISTTFMNSAMKNMHGSKLKLHEITSLDSFIL